MQYTGYIVVEGRPVLLLVRESATQRSLKLRRGGALGNHLSDEEIHLKENPEKLSRLLSGEVVTA